MENKGTKNVWAVLKKAPESAKIASFYGFTPIEGPRIKKEDKDYRCALIREINESKGIPLPQPFMIWTKNPNSKISPHRLEATLSIIGSNKSISEIILIQTARAILDHLGWKKTILRINAVGNKESISEFERKMSIFVRKHFNEFPSDLRQALKHDSLALCRGTEEKWKEWQEEAPQSIDCLSEESRRHFKEILELTESLEIPYVIDGQILGDLEIATETVFEIISDEETKREVLARGVRYNRLSKKLQRKKEIPAVDIVISAKALKPQKNISIKETKPKYYLIQFGPEAKQKSLVILEKLCKAHIPVLHSLTKDKLLGQMVSADQMNLPFILLVGQKEALENMVTVRNTVNRSQTTIPIESLVEYLKR